MKRYILKKSLTLSPIEQLLKAVIEVCSKNQ